LSNHKDYKYLPFIEDWADKNEYPRKPSVPTHRQCVFFDSGSCKCLKTIKDEFGNKVIRNVIVDPKEIRCKNFQKKRQLHS
jgi:hypothetical protein